MKMKKIIALAAITSLLLCGCEKPLSKKDLTYTDTLFDTVISVQILDPVDESVIKGCEKLCKDYDAKFSKSNEESDISRINSAKGKFVEVSEDTVTLLEKGIYYSELSYGIFDITIGSVSDLWDFHAEQPSVPSKKKVRSAKKHVSYHNIMIQDNRVKLTDPKTKLDVGAIAKGYIADQLKTYLLSSGVENAIISLGGNILLVGAKPDGSPFNVGIQKPFGAVSEVLTTLEKSDSSVVSSGCYERYFITNSDEDKNDKDRTIYHHIFDTATGYPVQNDLLGVTILSDSSMKGDALSTYCYILGLEKGLDYIRSLEDVEAVFVTKDYDIITSY